MAEPNRGPKGKVFEPQISPEARARMDREHREAVVSMTHGAMERMQLNSRCGVALERLNVICNKIGVPIVQLDALKKDFAQMIIDEALNGKMFDDLYKQYYNQKLSDLLAAGANAQNDDLIKSSPSGEPTAVFPRTKEITDTFENFMQSFAESMRDRGLRRANYMPEYGGNDAKGLHDIQIAAHNKLIKNSAQTAYGKCSRRGEATVAETCQAALRAVNNAFFYAKAFPQPSAKGVDANAPGMREAGIRESSDVIKGLQDVHAARSWRWMLRYPIDYMREAATIRSLKNTMIVRGGLTSAEAEQILSEPRESYEFVARNNDEIGHQYTAKKAAEDEKRLAEERRKREVVKAQERSMRKMRRDGMTVEAIDARGRAEFNDDMEALRILEEENLLQVNRESENERSLQQSDVVSEQDVSKNEKQPVIIEEKSSEEKSEPVIDNGRISAPQINIK